MNGSPRHRSLAALARKRERAHRRFFDRVAEAEESERLAAEKAARDEEAAHAAAEVWIRARLQPKRTELPG
jgi:hypothetical protein